MARENEQAQAKLTEYQGRLATLEAERKTEIERANKAIAELKARREASKSASEKKELLRRINSRTDSIYKSGLGYEAKKGRIMRRITSAQKAISKGTTFLSEMRASNKSQARADYSKLKGADKERVDARRSAVKANVIRSDRFGRFSEEQKQASKEYLEVYNAQRQAEKQRAYSRQQRQNAVVRGETTVTSSQNTLVYAGRGTGKRGDTRTENIGGGYELGFSELTGRAFLIRDGVTTGVNERILRAFQNGSYNAVDTVQNNPDQLIYMGATPTNTRRVSGFQYQPSENRIGQQPADQPSPVNFLPFQQAQQTGGNFVVPIEQRGGGKGQGFMGMNIITPSDVVRFERRVGRTALPDSEPSGFTVKNWRFQDTKVLGARDAPNTELSVYNVRGETTRVNTGRGFRDEFAKGVYTQVRERPLSTAGLAVLGYGTGGVATALSGTRTGAFLVNTATIGATTAYVGTVGAQAYYSGNAGRVLGRESVKALSFGSGYYFGAGTSRFFSRPRASARTGALTPERILAMNRRGGLRRGDVVEVGSDYYAGSISFNARTGRPILSARQRLTSAKNTATEGIKSLGGSRRGSSQLSILREPFTRLKPPKPRSQLDPLGRTQRRRTTGVVGRLRGAGTRLGGRIQPRYSNRFRTGFYPVTSTNLNTGSGFKPAFDFGLGSSFKPAFDLALGGALGLGLLAGGKGGGTRTGGGGLGAGGGFFGFGRGGLTGRGRRARYTPSFTALEFGVKAPRGYDRRGVFSGAEVRPI